MIRIGIAGYGNLGKGVEAAVKNAADMELVAVFTRRDPESVKIKTEGVKAYSFDSIADFKDKIDVIVNCGGSATDLPVTTPAIAENFSVIDSFDTHARIPEHFANVDAKAKEGGNIAVISVGWDPGMFSLNRLYMNAILPNGKDYTFWGRGVSQGHSDAIRRIDGVVDARQYTVPVESAVESVRNGENPELTTRQKHTRECYVVAEEGADKARIENEIKTMPNYFADYDTTVNFISLDELKKNHSGIPHGGSVIRSGFTGFDLDTKHTIEYSLKLESNPEFTGSVLTAYARAAYKLRESGETGCKTVFDIAPALLVDMDGDEIRAHML
ncbi:MAG: diaminopimelate dehydrogenase [Clostridiaceae bacterium]|nr:diaminopimelate dehydrogenase [Clostridiaceae bacterium]